MRKNVLLIQQSCECDDCNQCCSSSPQQVLDWIPFRSSHLAKSLQVFLLLCEMLGIVTTSAVDDKIIYIAKNLNEPIRTSTVKEYTDELVNNHANLCKKKGEEEEEVDREYVRNQRVVGRLNRKKGVYRGGPKIADSVEKLKSNLAPDVTDQENSLGVIRAEDINVNEVVLALVLVIKLS